MSSYILLLFLSFFVLFWTLKKMSTRGSVKRFSDTCMDYSLSQVLDSNFDYTARYRVKYAPADILTLYICK